VAYWNRTERPLWFDTAAGSVTVLTQCSANALQFDERPEGLVFRQRPGDRGVGAASAPGGICGRVEGGTTVVALDEGDLVLRVWCEPERNEFSVIVPGNTGAYLAPDRLWSFPVTRSELSPSQTPRAPQCTE
jgi:hypothetical protein